MGGVDKPSTTAIAGDIRVQDVDVASGPPPVAAGTGVTSGSGPLGAPGNATLTSFAGPASVPLAYGVVVQNPRGNVGLMAFGIDVAASAVPPLTGAQVLPGRSTFLAVADLNMIHVTWTVAGDEVTWWGG